MRRRAATSFMRRACALAVAACALCGPLPATAQTAAPPPVPAPTLEPPATPPPPALAQVRQYRLRGVTLLDPAAVEAALAGLTGERTVEELHRAATMVQTMYARAGYGAVVVYLPPQDVSAGVVTLEAIEGRVSAVRVEGAGSPAGEAAALASLPALQTGQTPRLDLIDIQLRMANENPARRLRLVLLPGNQPQQTEAEVAVRPGARHALGLELDNAGTPGSGRARVTLSWRDANISGRDDVLDLRLQTAPAHPQRLAVGSLSYRLPLYAQATMLDAYALLSRTRGDGIATVAGDLRFTGSGSLLGVRATRYLRRFEAFDQRVALGIERRAQRSQCTIATLPGDVCAGGSGGISSASPAGGDLALTPLTLDYHLSGTFEWPLAMSLSLSLVRGLALGGSDGGRAAFEAARPGAPPDFTLLRVQGSAAREIGADGWEIGARIAAQFAADPLVPAMQFGAGGRDSVRGHDERALAADHGLAASLELSAPRRLLSGVLPGTLSGATLRPLVFVDAAALRNRAAAPCTGTQLRCHLASAGFGLRLDTGAASMSLDVAHRLHDAGDIERGRTRVHLWLRFVH